MASVWIHCQGGRVNVLWVRSEFEQALDFYSEAKEFTVIRFNQVLFYVRVRFLAVTCHLSPLWLGFISPEPARPH